MKKLLALDVETTGIETKDGHRIIEIAGVEIIDGKITDNEYHQYIYPNRSVGNSEKIHGITDDFLQDKPQFSAIAQEFLAYIRDATLVIHNAPFDLEFLNNELQIMGINESIEDKCTVIDTLEICKQQYPKKLCNLDALCQHLDIDAGKISKNSTLLDAHIVAQVYLSITADDKQLDNKIKEASIKELEELYGKFPEIGNIQLFCKIIEYKFYPKTDECYVDAIASMGGQSISVEMYIFDLEKNGWTVGILDNLIASEKIVVVKAYLNIEDVDTYADLCLMTPKIVEVLNEKFNFLVENKNAVKLKIVEDEQE